jgi:hypothetical protein
MVEGTYEAAEEKPSLACYLWLFVFLYLSLFLSVSSVYLTRETVERPRDGGAHAPAVFCGGSIGTKTKCPNHVQPYSTALNPTRDQHSESRPMRLRSLAGLIAQKKRCPRTPPSVKPRQQYIKECVSRR